MQHVDGNGALICGGAGGIAIALTAPSIQMLDQPSQKLV
jgi:hypothetical protein